MKKAIFPIRENDLETGLRNGFSADIDAAADRGNTDLQACTVPGVRETRSLTAGYGAHHRVNAGNIVRQSDINRSAGGCCLNIPDVGVMNLQILVPADGMGRQPAGASVEADISAGAFENSVLTVPVHMNISADAVDFCIISISLQSNITAG